MSAQYLFSFSGFPTRNINKTILSKIYDFLSNLWVKSPITKIKADNIFEGMTSVLYFIIILLCIRLLK